MEIAVSARKHGIPDTEIATAVRLAMVQVAIAPDRDLLIGPDSTGRLLEVVLLDPDTDPVVIHAMPLRPKFQPLLQGR